MQDVVIVAATRTAVGSFQGSLASIPAPELGAAVIRRLLEQTGLDPAQVDEVILGHVLTAGSGQNPARQASILAGLPHAVPAMTLNKVCGSGLKALHLGAQAIRCGDADVIIAGGMENMSLAPYVLPAARTGLRQQLTDHRRAEVNRGNVRQRTLETANGSAGGGDNDDVLHGMIPHWSANCISGTWSGTISLPAVLATISSTLTPGARSLRTNAPFSISR